MKKFLLFVIVVVVFSSVAFAVFLFNQKEEESEYLLTYTISSQTSTKVGGINEAVIDDYVRKFRLDQANTLYTPKETISINGIEALELILVPTIQPYYRNFTRVEDGGMNVFESIGYNYNENNKKLTIFLQLADILSYKTRGFAEYQDIPVKITTGFVRAMYFAVYNDFGNRNQTFLKYAEGYIPIRDRIYTDKVRFLEVI